MRWPFTRRRPQFGPRTLLVLLVALTLGWKVNDVRTRRKAVAEIERLGGSVTYDGQGTSVTGAPADSDYFPCVSFRSWFFGIRASPMQD
jgi:hypothetical protein